MRPVSHQVLGDLFVVVWSDGHESYYPLEELRRACPCAGCSGEPDLYKAFIELSASDMEEMRAASSS